MPDTFEAMIFPLPSVPRTVAHVMLAIVISPWNHACHQDHSNTIPVIDMFVPFFVRKIDLMKITALGAIGATVKAFTAKNTQDIPKKNIVRFLKTVRIRVGIFVIIDLLTKAICTICS